MSVVVVGVVRTLLTSSYADLASFTGWSEFCCFAAATTAAVFGYAQRIAGATQSDVSFLVNQVLWSGVMVMMDEQTNVR